MKILIDFIDKALLIKDPQNVLTSSARLKLMILGFKPNSSLDSFSCENISKTAWDSTFEYFSEENVQFVSTNTVEEFSKSIENENANFTNTFELAKKFKEGNIDGDFSDYKDFLQQNVKRELLDHQIKASYHNYIVKNPANFSVPGSGKTTVALSVFEKLRLEGKVDTIFVIGPLSSFEPWKTEFQKTLGRVCSSVILSGSDIKGRFLSYSKSNNFPELHLISFQTLYNDQLDVIKFFNKINRKVFLIVDEAHYIKRKNGNWADAVLNIAPYSSFRCVLTGTPMPNKYSDLNNLFKILWLGQNPINSEISTRIEILNRNHENSSSQILKQIAENTSSILKDSIGPLFYRVRKSDLGLKEQISKIKTIKMNSIEQEIYDAISTDYYKNSLDIKTQDFSFLRQLKKARIIRLRQAVSFPKLLLYKSGSDMDHLENSSWKKNEDLVTKIYKYSSNEIPAKVQCLLKMLGDFKHKKEKVIIWSNFLGTIEYIGKILYEKGFEYKTIIGETPVENDVNNENPSHINLETREKIRLEFLDPKSGTNILIANPAACAESISLHQSCNNAIYYDLSYNCAQFIQSMDRIHRVGGSENQDSNYYFLQYQDTLDERIYQNLALKKQKMEAVSEIEYPVYNSDLFEEDDDEELYDNLFLNKS